MKVITIKQPWASLIASGIKEYEFRSWKTNYRGKLLIHAGNGVDKDIDKFKDLNLEYPKKRIVALVELIDCLKLDDELNKKIISENNIAYGNKYKEGYAWKIRLIKKIDSKEEINGKLGLWNIDNYE